MRKLFAMVALHHEYSLIVMTLKFYGTSFRKQVLQSDNTMYCVDVTSVVFLARL